MDLATMMRDQAKAGLQTQLAAAVADGNAEQAGKIADQIAQLAVSTAPKAPPYGQNEIKAAIGTAAPWFGTDPKKSARVIELGKHMDPAKFATAELFAAALIKAVDEDTKPPETTVVKDPPENETDEEREAREAEEAAAAEAEAAAKKNRRTNAPGDMGAGNSRRASSGPWTKLSDAPADIQKEVKRSADRFVPSSASKEQREKYITTALGAHYAAHQRKTAGKK